MRRFRAVSIVAVGVLVLGLASVALGMKEQPRPIDPPDYAVGRVEAAGPFVILQQGDTTWVTPYANELACPGDSLEGHGGEAVGGPDGSETWCFQNGPGDTCGTVPPWDTECFDHVDVRSFPSMTGINYWHRDTYRADQQLYTGDWCLWCGSGELWEGNPVECGTWLDTPGYGNQWNCIVQLTLPDTFTVANGCTVYFDPRYDTECKYDYFYCDFYDGAEWQTVAMFNATSNNPGTICGNPSSPNPDYWGNTDTGQPNSANWQQRAVPTIPAFGAAVDTVLGTVTEGPMIRWRFTSDGAWSDMDGRGNTDGAAFIDNVWIVGDPGMKYVEDFETGMGGEWSLPDPDPIAQAWHQIHDPDPPFEGGDGGDRTTCTLDSSIVWRARPEGGYPGGAAWRNGWFYRLLSPVVSIENTGCVVQYDDFMCCLEYTCDYTDTKVRFHTTDYGWCPWINIDKFILYGGCFFWNFDFEEDVTPFYGPTADLMQFGWDLMDVSNPGDFCRGKHKQTDHIVDNVSIGFFDGAASIFTTRVIDLLQDSFHDSIVGYNSQFDAYDFDTLDYYADEAHDLRWDRQLRCTVTDKDKIREVRLYGSIDEGATWEYEPYTLKAPSDPLNPELGGEMYGTLAPSTFTLARWAKGTEIWYFLRCEDQDGTPGNYEYFPADANPLSPDHTGTREDYFTFSILPIFPPSYTDPKILLVDGYGRNNYDYAECMAASDNLKSLEDIYEETLVGAGYCYDKFDISGAGSNIHIHPIEYGDYEAVVWFTGPYFSNYLFDKEAQEAIRAYLNDGGKVILCGDRIAYNMADPIEGGVGEDSLGGEFLGGIMGCDYQAFGEMESAFEKPYVYLEAATSVTVFGTPRTINPTFMNKLLVYRECPYLKDQSYVITNSSPPAGYTAQPLLYVLNPDPAFDPADGAIYVEKPAEGGQCVYVNYDLCAFATHYEHYCSGTAPPGLPPYDADTYDGRVDLIRTILEELFGIASKGAGGGGTSDIPPGMTYRWALSQNTPNPCAASTEIRFEVAKTSQVSIKVYNAMGQLVRTLEDRQLQPGKHSVTWDGSNSAGQRVSSGVYFYKMNGDRFDATKKMLVVK